MKLKSEYSYDGLVWEVPLTGELGYAYVQTIDPRPLKTGFPSFIMKILDFHGEKPLAKFDEVFFGKLDMLTSHLFFMGRPPQRKGDIKWKALGYLPITSFDRTIPESKLLSKYDEPFSYYEIPKNSLWSVYWEGSLADYYNEEATYEQVKHLGFMTHFNVAFIHHRITMEWMRKLGLDYTKYFTEQLSEEFLKRQIYQVKNTMLFSEVGPDIRGKAIGSFTKDR